jgi:hypothetical protein
LHSCAVDHIANKHGVNFKVLKIALFLFSLSPTNNYILHHVHRVFRNPFSYEVLKDPRISLIQQILQVSITLFLFPLPSTNDDVLHHFH